MAASKSISNHFISLEDGWKEIKTGIDKIEAALNDNEPFKKIMKPNEYIALYATIYDMCTQRSPYNWTRELHQRHGETIENYLTNKVLPAVRDKTGEGGTVLLLELQHQWSNSQIMNKWLKKIFTYLDRYYVKHESLPSLSQTGLNCFRKIIFDEVKFDVAAIILDLINDEREGRTIDRTLVKSVAALYETLEMGSMDTYVDEQLWNPTREFYGKKREAWIHLYSTPDYINKVEEDALNVERDRVADYLDSSTESKLLLVVGEVLLGHLKMNFIDEASEGCHDLLQFGSNSEDLQRKFRLLSHLQDGLNPIATIVRTFVAAKGLDIMNQRRVRWDGDEQGKSDDLRIVKDLIELHEKYKGIIKTDFLGHAILHKALDDAMVEIVNVETGLNNAMFLSTCCDHVLKSSGEVISQEELDKSIDWITHLVSYLTDKDAFEDVYCHQLAKRLLDQISKSTEAEKRMLAKLTLQSCWRMKGMLDDLERSNVTCSGYETDRTTGSDDLEFSVNLLRDVCWPMFKSPRVALPPPMTQHVQSWQERNSQQPNLKWVFSLCNAVVQGTFGTKVYTFELYMLQAVVLNALSGGRTLTFESLSNSLNLDEDVLKPVLHSLSCGNYKVVTKLPPGNTIDTSDQFTANPSFTCDMQTIRIPMASLESIHDAMSAQNERSLAMEASVVRVVRKHQKSPAYEQDMDNFLAELTFFFKLDALAVKGRIDALNEFAPLKRSVDDSDVPEVRT